MREDRSKRIPMALLSYQQKWCADTSDVKVCEKSRRIGLTWSEAADSSLVAASKNGMDVYYIGYNKDMAQEFIEDCADWSKHYDHAAASVEEFIFKDGPDKDILGFRIRYASGHKIVALSSRPSNLRGKQGKVIIDEAAFHESLDELIKAAMALLMWGGKVVIISTHDGEDNPFNELIHKILAGKLPYSLHRITLDDALEQGLYKRICLRLGRQWSQKAEQKWRQDLIDLYGTENADEELFCIPSSGSGSYLTRVMIEACMSEDIPVLRWNSPCSDFVQWDDRQRYLEMNEWLENQVKPVIASSVLQERYTWIGEDFGRTLDLTVMWPIQDMPGLTYRTPFVVELRDCPFTQQEQVLFYIIDKFKKFTGGALDKGGNGAFLAERASQKYGADRIEEVSFSAKWYIENMPPMKACFEDKTTTIPRDNEILDDFRAIKKVRGVPRVPADERTLSKYGGKRHGDAAIAKSLAVYAARKFEYYNTVPEVCTASASSEMDAYQAQIDHGKY